MQIPKTKPDLSAVKWTGDIALERGGSYRCDKADVRGTCNVTAFGTGHDPIITGAPHDDTGIFGPSAGETLNIASVEIHGANSHGYAFRVNGGTVNANAVNIINGGLLFMDSGTARFASGSCTGTRNNYMLYQHGLSHSAFDSFRFVGPAQNSALVRCMGGTLDFTSNTLGRSRIERTGGNFASVNCYCNGGTWNNVDVLGSGGFGQMEHSGPDGLNKDAPLPSAWTLIGCRLNDNFQIHAGCHFILRKCVGDQKGGGGIMFSGSTHYNANGQIKERGPARVEIYDGVFGIAHKDGTERFWLGPAAIIQNTTFDGKPAH